MKVCRVENDGSTTIELTDAEAHELRDVLGKAAKTGDDASWTMHRLLSFAHGEPEK
ncbi:hypothetical protein [Streptomyces sp. 8L]|uniref:hypothetical protein n=1 Tax=Streptomyces sp. 8L TaxID=2877242 RepID=UPI001CD3C35A|nr:hypothetical protein [Streptomyces sp. 8L]MCA1223558.1 hypothetical protein [Streptomyces sp. 8L]